MDQKEHIATLCALGTVGAAAAGLAFATDQIDSYLVRPGKRKWPGASSDWRFVHPTAPGLARRSVTQPATPTVAADTATHNAHASPLTHLSSAPKFLLSSRDQPLHDEPSSRGSSTSRRSILRPRTTASRSTNEKRESSSSSGWLKRISTYSSHSTSPAPSFMDEKAVEMVPRVTKLRPSTSTGPLPNKLVKRSVSLRGLSHNEPPGHILSRPATSHQRARTFQEIRAWPKNGGVEAINSDRPSGNLPPLPTPEERRQWRSYFETSFPRKRRKSETAVESSQIRVVSMPVRGPPTMVLGTVLDESPPAANLSDRPPRRPVNDAVTPSTFRRSRRSFSSLRRMNLRRNVTDPSLQVSSPPAQGTVSVVNATFASSLSSQDSTIAVQVPPYTPQYTSSPPLSYSDGRDSFHPRLSISVSDPATTSSDADGRVFSDVDSLDFQSDTAYDSIATRTTAVSNGGRKESKLETIFAARPSDETEARHEVWHGMDRDSIQLNGETGDTPWAGHDHPVHGIGIDWNAGKDTPPLPNTHDAVMATPPRSASPCIEDFSQTPVPTKQEGTELESSPPWLPTSGPTKEYDLVGDMLEDMNLEDGDEVDWPIDDAPHSHDSAMAKLSPVVALPGPAGFDVMVQFQEPQSMTTVEDPPLQRTSIFEWSEHHPLTNVTRPKTVHGKQGNTDRSRSAGRKGPPQLHFRSQSVPVNREGPGEDLPMASKCQTWRLGQKPVSEEWSDDFEFDDTEPADRVTPVTHDNNEHLRNSVRSVKIPQAIMDRQPSVHLQFGQVQKFMELVEELKRLRTKGAALQLLDGTARHLWEDAESIINLATINDEEDEIIPIASSPPSSDPFVELPPTTPPPTSGHLTARVRRSTTTGRRSVSTIDAPPVHGRARGESLAQARHFLQAMYQTRGAPRSSPREIEIHHQKKLPFDTQDLKDLVIRSGAITKALKDEVRRAEGISNSPQKTPTCGSERRDDEHPLSEMFKVPEQENTSPCPPFRKPSLPKSRSANSYLDSAATRQPPSPFSSPITLAAVV